MLRASMYMRASMRASIRASMSVSDECRADHCVSTILRASVGFGGVSQNDQRVFRKVSVSQNVQRVFRTISVSSKRSARLQNYQRGFRTITGSAERAT